MWFKCAAPSGEIDPNRTIANIMESSRMRYVAAVGDCAKRQQLEVLA